MPFDIEIKRKGVNTYANIKASIENPKVFIDWISEFAGIVLTSADTLTISWNVNVYLSVNDNIKDTKSIQIRKTFTPKDDITVRFARLVHYKNKSRIYVYEKLPKLKFPEE
jgi:hypothetical protein